MKTLTIGIGKLALLLATLAVLTAAGLFILGGFLITWPVLRQNPRSARNVALVNVAAWLMALAGTFKAVEDGTIKETGDNFAAAVRVAASDEFVTPANTTEPANVEDPSGSA